MRDRNKGVEAYNNNNMDCYYPSNSCELFTCKKHPSSSSVGICAFCLKDRLVNLVCSDCGEQRLSSCSCSDDISTSHRNSSAAVDVGSVGRVSFLIDNDKNNNQTPPILQNLPSSSSSSNINNKLFERVVDEATVLRRSSGVEIKKNNSIGKFWKIGKLFRKNNNNNNNSKKTKEYYCGRSVGGCHDNNGNGGNYVNHGAVSRSRSLCSFRGGALFGSDDGTDSVVPSAARSSISAARSSGVNGGLFLESGRRSGYSEAATEPRKSGFDGLFLDSSSDIMDGGGGGGGGFYGVNRRVFSLRESDFKGMDESSFIDLKLDYSSESRAELFPPSKMMMMSDNFGSTRHGGGGGDDGDFVVGDGVSLTSGGGGGGSCRISGRGMKSMKGWRWIFRYSNSTNRGSARKRDQQQDLMFNA
ncbi:hypothetical protein PIB30_027174 [Stylosanthes scabra]|uniref:Uncharacterized protein n=1 Tax=Stylosanthes scabra TaxID=79078 RepID=A0ABU6QA34_9FABA|nr:hypothetical protein [Stylosanthes scabra]